MKQAGATRVRPSQAARYLVKRPEQRRALESPARLQVVDTIAALGPSSVAAVAQHLGEKRESLYFHVARLEEVGLLRACGERGEGRERETLYDTPGRAIAVEHQPGDEASAKSLARMGAANLRLAIRGLLQAFRSKARTRGRRRELHVARLKGWLNPQDLGAANELLDQLEELFRQGRRRSGARLYSLTAAFLPDTPKEPS